jgi:hypothetical protein
MLPVRPVMGKPTLPGSFHTRLAVLPELLAAAGLLIVGSDMPQPVPNSRY